MLNQIVSFLLGFGIGYVFRVVIDKLTKGKSELLTRKTSEELVIFLVIIAWFASMFVSFYNGNYEVPVAVHGLMGSIVALLGIGRPKSSKGGDNGTN